MRGLGGRASDALAEAAADDAGLGFGQGALEDLLPDLQVSTPGCLLAAEKLAACCVLSQLPLVM